MKKKGLFFVSLLLILSMFLAACNGKDEKGAKETDKPETETKGTESEEKGSFDFDFPTETSNQDEPIKDADLLYGIRLTGPFEGTFHRLLLTSIVDEEIMDFFDEPLLDKDEDGIITNDGAATYELSDDNKTITLTIRDDVYWHDGEPVKASDLLYSYEILGHPDYPGLGYGFLTSIIEGMPEYREGKADTISGIEVSDDDKTISITYTQAAPSLLSSVLTHAVPRHYLGDITTGEITFDDMIKSEKIRTTPIGFGPYKVTKVLAGEAVTFERNEDYWRGQPGVKSIVLQGYSNETLLKSFENGEIDIAAFPESQYESALKLDNVEYLGILTKSYDYIAFKLGQWDEDKQENVMDPDNKLADKRVRKALVHAVELDSVSKELYNGLRVPATTAISPITSFHDPDNPGIPYDPEKANELLDEAGYIDVDGDGLREDPDGEEFTLTFALGQGTEIQEALGRHYIQSWEDVGIKVELFEGRLHEYVAFYDMLNKDKPGIDIFAGANGIGDDPDPTGHFGREAIGNITRYTSEKNDELLEAGISEKAFDIDYRRDIYNQWQALMTEDAWMSPILYRSEFFMTNKRVANFSIKPGTENAKHWKWTVTEEDSIVHGAN